MSDNTVAINMLASQAQQTREGKHFPTGLTYCTSCTNNTGEERIPLY